MIATLIALSASILTAAPVPARCSLEDIAFVAGHWRAQLGSTVFEEMAMPAAHGDITASMRMIPGAGRDDAAPVLWELINYSERDGGVVMLIRHFSRGLTPWDAEVEGGPVEVVVTEIEPGKRAVFSDLSETPRVVSITYERPSADSLVVTVLTPGDEHPLVIEYAPGR